MPIQTLTRPYPTDNISDSLTPLVKHWFLETFTTYSPPQRYSILNIKQRKNTLISSPTGSGKTLSAFLAIIDDLLHQSNAGTLEDRVYCVYISPLKALGNDIKKNLEEPLAQLQARAEKDLGIRVGTRTGDTTPHGRAKLLKTPPHILITTPESFALMLTSPKFSELMHNIDWVVIDEIHALADNKRGTQLSLGLERLATKTTFTRIGLSATVSPLSEVARFLVGKEDGNERDCDIVDVTYEKNLDIQVLSPVKNMLETPLDDLLTAQYGLINDLVQTHKTTIIFTNTRAATERVVYNLKKRYPGQYTDKIDKIDDTSEEEGDVRTTIAAHHGSLSKRHRLLVEQQLRDGKLKAVVSSTSLELGIDIGYVDLVILLGSPKSVARALQRIGRSGHKLHETAKGRIIVLDRDDLVECSVLAREALQRHIDTIHIPHNCLDVLAQEIYGIAITDKIHINDLYTLITNAHPYNTLTREQLRNVIKYLSGGYSDLEDRHVYAKIWYDEDTGMIGRKGRLARMLYSTNIGTIPDQTNVIVKIGDAPIGSISEPFLESLKRGDVFVLGGEPYEFRFARGMTAQVKIASGRRPTVPSWFSEMLPLSYDLARAIQTFRGHVEQAINNQSAKEVTNWLKEYLPVDEYAANSIYEYHKQQHLYAAIPTNNKIIIEHFREQSHKYVVFHTLIGRRANDVLSRGVAYALAKTGGGDVEIGINDNGFYVRYHGNAQANRAFSLLRSEQLRELMHRALRQTEVLRRRFRHAAGRSLMILRNYKGRKKTVGKQQVSSRLLMAAVQRLGEDFPIYQEAEREVLEDKMDIHAATEVLEQIEQNTLRIETVTTELPSPFAHNLILQGYADVMKAEERHEFLRRLHHEIMAQVSLRAKKEDVETLYDPSTFSYEQHWEEETTTHQPSLKEQLYQAAKTTKTKPEYVYHLQRLIEGDTKGYPQEFIQWLTDLLSGTIPKAYPDALIKVLKQRLPEIGWE